MSNQAQSNEIVLWLLGMAVVLVLSILLLEYLTRRVRYMWKLRKTHEQLLPRFSSNPGSPFSSPRQKARTS
ncbi:MAG: hypothetical protein ACK4UN_05535 [Limisphaerales bacterium]